MKKETSNESPKKRKHVFSSDIPEKRKTSAVTSSSATSNSASKEDAEQQDIYKVVITAEEKEAMERDPEKDSATFLKTCDTIRSNITKIERLKNNGDEKAKEEIKELSIQTCLSFLHLKKLNRMEKFRTNFSRDALNAAKSNVDSRNLQLQNLLYEVMHLKKEVVKCLQFKSKDEDIELVSLEEFYANAPENISRPEITKNNDHQMRLSRLEWELTQRKELAALCDELTKNKKSVGNDIEKKKIQLDKLKPQLLQILEASKPLQEGLGLPLQKIKEEHKKASLLPTPLYILYSKAAAYQDAYDQDLSVSVEGDQDEGQIISNQENGHLQESDSDLEMQIDNVVEETTAHKKRHHRMSKEARLEEKKKKLLQRHPLRVTIIMTFGNHTILTLNFFYMSVLKVVTVESEFKNREAGAVSTRDMLISESILRELYSNDAGIESPNPANIYQLSKHKLGSLSSLGLGKPYKWAQRMAGLHFIASDVQEKKLSREELAQHNVENVIRDIKKRVKARLELSAEIRQLENGVGSNTDNQENPIHWKISTAIKKFTTSSWKNFSSSFRNRQPELVSPDDIFYEALLQERENQLTAQIAIKPNYPKMSAFVSISMKDEKPGLSETLRDIEREVNVMWEKPPTLSMQMKRLRQCFDIYLQTEGIAEQDKTFFFLRKSRTRARPYKFVAQGNGIFTQR